MNDNTENLATSEPKSCKRTSPNERKTHRAKSKKHSPNYGSVEKKRHNSDLKEHKKTMVRSSSHNTLQKTAESKKKTRSSRRTVSDIDSSSKNHDRDLDFDVNIPNPLPKNDKTDLLKISNNSSNNHKTTHRKASTATENKVKSEPTVVRKDVTKSKSRRTNAGKTKKRKACSLHDFLNGTKKDKEYEKQSKSPIFNGVFAQKEQKEDSNELKAPATGFMSFQIPIIDIHKQTDIELEIAQKFSFQNILERLHRNLSI